MEEEMNNRLAILEQKIDAMYVSVEKTRKYFQITLWVTVAFFVAPLILLLFAVPMMLTSYTSAIADPATLELLR